MQKVKEKSNWKGETIVEIEIETEEYDNLPEFENFAMVAAKIAGIKTVPKMCSLEDKLLCACEDSYLPEKYIEQTKQLITTRIAVLKEG